MSIPDDRLSTSLQPAPFLYWDAVRWEPYTAHAQGGIALQDPSQGLEVQLWRAFYRGTTVWLQAVQTGEEALLVDTGERSRYLSLAFNQNMDWHLTWEDAEGAKMRWWDTAQNGYATWVEPGARGPGICLDEHRSWNVLRSDVLFFYLKGSKLYYRQQRERFSVERELGDVPENALAVGRVGMMTNLRVGIEIRYGVECEGIWDEEGDIPGGEVGNEWEEDSLPMGTVWPPCPGIPGVHSGQHLILQTGWHLLLQTGKYLRLQDQGD
jgi:hypothetical protein